MSYGFLFLLLVGGSLFFASRSYNSLQKLAQSVKEKSSNAQIALSKKIALINQLIDVVRNFQEGEQFTILKISEDNSNAATLANTYQQSGTLLTTVQGVADQFPNLKASEQYHRLINNIESCEKDLQNYRQLYNSAVRSYNETRLTIPTIFIANTMGFTEAPYLEFNHTGEAQPIQLKDFKTDDGERLKKFISDAGNTLGGATKSLAKQATETGKKIADRIAEKSAKNYFYITKPGEIPKGPVSFDVLKEMHASGEIGEEAKIAETGTDQWKEIQVVFEEGQA
ncbi:MAG TPA: LemA family protein [Catalimonadaceae bacterium]|nr:LemA family protein [Catalimonadaceae bacterium]